VALCHKGEMRSCTGYKPLLLAPALGPADGAGPAPRALCLGLADELLGTCSVKHMVVSGTVGEGAGAPGWSEDLALPD